jgi:hypothetical protein
MGTPIDRALRRGVRDALLQHKRLGQRVATWQDGRVVVLEPHEIPVGRSSKTPPRLRKTSKVGERR